MLSLSEIREDLKEIRYYYSKQKLFDAAAHTAHSHILDLAQRYNNAIKNAPARLYDLYISLYVQNNTQAALAYDWGCTENYIKVLNKQLCEYLQHELG